MHDAVTANATELLDGYAAFLRLMGHRVVQTPGSLWFTVRRGVYQPAFPFHQDPRQPDEAQNVLRCGHALACRWFSLLEDRLVRTGGDGPAVFVARPPYELSRLESKARNQTRRGLERIEVKRVSFIKNVEDQAFPVYADNVRRLRLFRSNSALQERWIRWARALCNSPVLDFWGAWHQEGLVAFTITARTPWGLEILCQRSLASALNLYPNNSLVFSIVNNAFKEGQPLISYGLSEFSAGQAGLDHFKKGMAFEAVPLRENYQWNPLIRPFACFLTPARLRRFARIARPFLSG